MGKPTILIVEDDDISIFVLKKMLEPDFHVKVAHNSNEAWEIWEEEDFQSLVLMDINLGEADMDGTRLMQQMKAKTRGHTPIFIAVTSYALAGDREYFLEQGFEDYIPKPVDRHYLMSTLSSYRQ